ncbi:MAG: HAD-IA family hydrolase [Bacillota bacterium]|nr:HAD-IA family hydrolase [Bacillota bacterium]
MINLEVKGIIFDMDNTLLASRIDFTAMKEDISQLMIANKLMAVDFNYMDYTASQLIKMAQEAEGINEEISRQIWQAVTDHEARGMVGAKLEEGIVLGLQQLKPSFTLAVLTNNGQAAAELALNETGIADYFDLIVGRDKVKELKPDPAGVRYIIESFPEISIEEWVLVGDSWIDGKAAQECNIAFIAYQGNKIDMNKQKVFPVASIGRMEQLLSLFGVGGK